MGKIHFNVEEVDNGFQLQFSRVARVGESGYTEYNLVFPDLDNVLGTIAILAKDRLSDESQRAIEQFNLA